MPVRHRWHDGAVPEPLRVAYTLEQCWHDVPGGTAVAALEVHRRLRACDDVEVIAVAGRHRRPPSPPYRPEGSVRMLPVGRPLLYETWNRLGWPRVESSTGPVDVCHSTLAIPAATRRPHVVTIHDVAFVHTPERFSRHGAGVMRRGLERCRRADLVLCPSRTTADDLVALDFDRGRIRIVPWGVEAVDVTADDLARVRRTHDLPDRFALFVGTIEPRKNLPRLVEAMRAIPDLPLVVAGAEGWGETASASGGARLLGFVPAPDLRPVMQAATVLVYPSLEEGFGLPILEAMAQGTAVVTSRGSATEEVADGAAVLVDPLDVVSITDGVRVAAADSDRWSQRSLERAGQLTWDRTVAATVDAYREVAR